MIAHGPGEGLHPRSSVSCSGRPLDAGGYRKSEMGEVAAGPWDSLSGAVYLIPSARYTGAGPWPRPRQRGMTSSLSSNRGRGCSCRRTSDAPFCMGSVTENAAGARILSRLVRESLLARIFRGDLALSQPGDGNPRRVVSRWESRHSDGNHDTAMEISTRRIAPRWSPTLSRTPLNVFALFLLEPEVPGRYDGIVLGGDGRELHVASSFWTVDRQRASPGLVERGRLANRSRI